MTRGASSHEGPWTFEEWIALPPSHGHVELVDGILVVNPNEAYPDQRLMVRIWRQLDDVAPPELEVMPDSNVRVGVSRGPDSRLRRSSPHPFPVTLDLVARARSLG